ncbi:response regulator [Dictyobacter aurantiacus]|uniref:Response regulatory domain-containing protein n=1 Tax=Dictyobacter aurantiacus TaxID=1936993 RepID=A0A401ZHA2_9CHLR|nr:response regulator [Dictyobacter aurantiacus]GCE06261.1 hypothetical protein KDAU_35900 [Dictyobacter aurantiacus]
MSDVCRIIVVASDDTLNQSVVSSLRKDGYIVQGVMSGADAVRVLWSEEYDVVICDVKTPGVNGFELLQWLRAYRPNVRMIMLGDADMASSRMQALESGAVSYFEKPLDLRLLKEELRRLLQPTGFSASLDSFDLLDVIQMVNMSRKSITLLVNTGLEERGILRFQNGELIWAEYGLLRAEEAFFALAAHKNGTVIHQPWNEQIASNVTQPLSRLIFQALQYRTKYADRQQYSGEIERIQEAPAASSFTDIDDTPFMVLAESPAYAPVFEASVSDTDQWAESASAAPAEVPLEKEWWERTGRRPRVEPEQASASQENDSMAAPTMAMNGQELMDMLNKMNDRSRAQAAPIPEQNNELPGWLMDQPTSSQRAIPKPAADMSSSAAYPVPATPDMASPTNQWPEDRTLSGTTGQFASNQLNGLQETEVLRPSRSVWDSVGHTTSVNLGIGNLDPYQSASQAPVRHASDSGALAVPTADEGSQQQASSGTLHTQQAARRNYAALVSALQTLGYSVPGFIAAIVATIDGQPIAQVAIDDMDVTSLCRHYSAIQRGVLQAVAEQDEGGTYEHTVVTSRGRQIFMHMVGTDQRIFQVLITTREAEPAQCIQLMTNVEETLSTALQ